ncbi:UDP-glucuronosyl/UDP-glucosyltransferase [Macleaya cordata]|uniref:UDP-glucuronosyl/UDP-glucosyltransferase n=1 Tax=Macleaya cordata TaxID=56857 RepID=A0A200QY95_MACCD|nr:UDP-glucuronosyl/UDP-glucosyltransferase [Macleaya cordata]
MSTTTTSTGAAHILVFPYPAQGHMIPLLDLSHQLSLRGLTITILVTPKNLPILNPLLSQNHSNIQTLILPFPDHPSIPHGVENVKDLPPSLFRVMMRAMGELYNPILHWFNSHPSPPVAIISDFFLGWTHHLASHLRIPRIVFFSSGAMGVAVIDSMFRDVPKNDDDNPNVLISFRKIPNSPVYPWWQLPSIFLGHKEGDPDSEFIRDGLLANMESWGMVFNTFNELESVYLDHFRKRNESSLGYCSHRVWAVGPLLPPNDEDDVGSTDRGGSSSSVETDDLLSWLDTCPDHSVVYVCFGSQAVLRNNQMEALAAGLECSGARFLWCVKEATEGHAMGEYGMVPTGFEDRTAGRGLVIRGWAPQLLILRHRAVGSFLTHCGWNSVLEGLSSGVVMLAWPMRADQYVDATLLVDQMRVAVKVCEGADTVPDSAELGRAVAESVNENRPERIRTMELRKAAYDAVKEGGSSFKDLDSLARDLCGLHSVQKLCCDGPGPSLMG